MVIQKFLWETSSGFIGLPMDCPSLRRSVRSTVCSRLSNFVLAHYEAEDLLRLQKSLKKRVADEGDAGGPTCVRGDFTVDLGLTKVGEVCVYEDGVSFKSDNAEENDDELIICWKDLKKMAKKGRTGAFNCSADGFERIASFSEETQRALSLYPLHSGVPPTVVLGGFVSQSFASELPLRDCTETFRRINEDLHLHSFLCLSALFCRVCIV